MTVDWAKAAVPQPDGSDTAIVLSLLAEPRERVAGDHRMFDGRAAVRALDGPDILPPRFVAAPGDHPNIARAEELLRRSWPEMYAQCGDLLTVIHPYRDTSLTPEERRTRHGSSSHSFDLGFGRMRTTVDNAFGLAQAFVHETAHHKLRVFGVDQESAKRLIANGEEMLRSPVLGYTRPVTAVVHAQYSFMHVLALDVAMFERAHDEETRAAACYLTERNLVRMENGRDALADGLRPDADGRAFFAAFDEWSAKTLTAARRIVGHSAVSSSG